MPANKFVLKGSASTSTTRLAQALLLADVLREHGWTARGNPVDADLPPGRCTLPGFR
jgi:hypothetical protein